MTSNSRRNIRPRPKPWKYLLVATLSLIVLLPLSLMFDLIFYAPWQRVKPGMEMNIRPWTGMPLVALTLLAGGRWVIVAHRAELAPGVMGGYHGGVASATVNPHDPGETMLDNQTPKPRPVPVTAPRYEPATD